MLFFKTQLKNQIAIDSIKLLKYDRVEGDGLNGVLYEDCPLMTFQRSVQILKDICFSVVLRCCVRFNHIFLRTMRFKNNVRKVNDYGTLSLTTHYKSMSKVLELVLLPFDRESFALSREV